MQNRRSCHRSRGWWAVEVELVVGNAGGTEDELTLTILDATGQTMAVVTKTVPTTNSDHVLFLIPGGGAEVSPGQIYRLKLTGGTTFGWKYVVGGYNNGEATFNGKPLLPGTRSTSCSGHSERSNCCCATATFTHLNGAGWNQQSSFSHLGICVRRRRPWRPSPAP